MSYLLSVDLGTTFSAAALRDGDGVEIFSLGSQTATIPSVVALRADGTVLTGEAADRRGVTEPARVAREFKRRLGDPTPMVIGGTPYGAETLMADLLRAIVDQVAQQQAGAPATVVLSHPANYGPYKLDLLGQVGHLAELDHVEFITEPQAAAVHYLELDRIESGEVVAVYDLGGGTFDAALVRRNDADFELLGTPDGLERFGGVDLDEAVFDHVRRSLGRAMEGLDPNDPTVTSALVRLREDCRAAKEALSSDTDTAIPVMLPALHTEVRLTRGEFEDMIRPRLRETMTMLQRVVASAGLGFDDMSQVLLVGGSSRIPLVGEMVQEATGLPIGLAAHPKHAIALGAASAGEATTRQAPIAAVLVVAEHEPPPPSEEPEPSEPPDEPEPPPPPEQPETAAPEEAPSIRSSRRSLEIVAATALVLLVSFGAWALLGGGEDDPLAGGEDDPFAGGSTTTTMGTTSTTLAPSTAAMTETSSSLPFTIEVPPLEWPQAFLDTFDIDTGRWSTVSLVDPQFGSLQQTIGDGVYTWEVVAREDAFWRSVDEDFESTDFYVATQVNMVIGAGSYGIVFRHIDASNFYIVVIEDSEGFSVSAQIEGEWRTIVPKIRSSQIKTSGINHLAVLGTGSHYQFFINHLLVMELDDDLLDSGFVGLAVEVRNPGELTIIEFQSIELRCTMCDPNSTTTTRSTSPKPTTPTTPPTTAPPSTTTTTTPTTTPTTAPPSTTTTTIRAP